MKARGQKTHWTTQLFVQHADLYLPFLEQAKDRAQPEVNTLAGLFAEFGVPAGGRVLDVACGIGRHSVPLAKCGYRVTGIDLSSQFIEDARRYAREEGVDVEFAVGDFLSLEQMADTHPRFDAIVNMFTSHSYYGRDGDLKMFGDLRRLASPGAVLVVLTANRDFIVRHFQPVGIDEAGDVRIVQRRRFDIESSHMMNTWEFYRQGDGSMEHVLTVEMDHRMYSLHELTELLESVNWRVERNMGRLPGAEFRLGEPSVDSNTLWVVAVN